MHFWRHVIFAGGSLPHGYCYVRTPGLGNVHAVSNSLIAASDVSIPQLIRNGPAEIFE